MAERGEQHEIDRLVDEAMDTGRAPETPEELRDEVELQRRVDDSLRAAFAPPERVVDASSLRVDRVIDDAIDLGRAVPVDDELTGEVDLQRRVDDALRRQMSPADAPLAIRSPRRRMPAMLIAASVLVVIGAAVMVALLQDPPQDRLTKLYVAHVESGFIQFPCETPEQFQAWMEDNFEQSVRPQPVEALTFHGWNYDNPISRYTGVMLGEARGEDVIILVDRLERDVNLTPPNPGLRLFRRPLGDLVFYELTPLEEPVFIPTFEIIDE